MDSSTSFYSKMTKVENLLSIVNNEVDSAIRLLHCMKQHSYDMVETLKEKTSSSVFLKEFLEINSFLLKYLDFVTEINCKFEILQACNKEDTLVNFQNSLPAMGVEFKSNNTKSDVNSKDNSVVSTLLPKSATLDYLSDFCNSNSSESSCTEKVSVRNKSKRSQKNQNKRLTVTEKNKGSKYNEQIETSYSYSGYRQIPINGVQSPKPSANGMFKETNDNINEGESSIHSLMESKENFEQEFSISEGSPQLKEFVNNSTCNKDQYETLSPPVTAGIPDTGVLYTKFANNITQEGGEINKDMSRTVANNHSFSELQTAQLEACTDLLYEIKPVNISRKLWEEFNVIVEHIISPSEFYVYILQNELHSFTELEEKLKLVQRDQSFHKKKESKNSLSQTIGKYALYYSKCEEKWCRAKITDWRVNHKDNLVYIFLLDYGESKCVTLDEIQEMPNHLKLYPAFVQRCHLFGIYPAELNLSSKTLAWGKAASEKMKCLVDTSKDFKIKIGPEDTYHPAKSLPVTLWLVDQGDTCVNDLLVKSQHAQWARKPESLRNFSENKALEKWNPMKEDFDSYLNSYDLDMKDPAAVIYGYVGKDYDRICKHFAKTGKCFKGQSCKKEHVSFNPSGFTTDKEEVYKNAVNALPLPPPKSLVSVQVTCILSLNVFCCIRDESAWIGEEETLQSLVEYMNCKENIRDMKKLLIPPSVGQLVIAKYGQDKSWYRAKILESQPESDQYSVFFVDYGNKETMPLSCIRAIEGRYLHLPFQAMKCCIFGIKQKPKVPVKEGMDYLNKRMSEEPVNLEVVATFPGDHPQLLVRVFDQNGKDIASELIDKEFAVFKEELIVDSESTSIPG